MEKMRTTIDIPTRLLRQAKARAAMRGIRLMDLVAEALQKELLAESGLPTPSAQHREGFQVLAEDCVFPIIEGECSPAMREMTGEKIGRILEEEEVKSALRLGGR